MLLLTIATSNHYHVEVSMCNQNSWTT